MGLSEPHIVLVGGDGRPSGVPRHITDLVRVLQGQATVTVISEENRGGYDEIEALGARHVAVPGLASTLDPRRWRLGRAALAAALNALPADLVWGHARLPILFLRQMHVSGQWPGSFRSRLAVTYHGLPFGPGHRFGTGPIARRTERGLLKACEPLDLIFLTESQRDRMQTAMGAAMIGHRCHVLGNASHLGPWQPQEGVRRKGRHIVMTGRVGYQKNLTAALRLMRHLPDDITLSLCGAGTDEPRFAALARRVAGPAVDRVRFLGPVADVRPVLASADGYMLTSRYEGQPIGALEASEYGLPLILSEFEGARALSKDHPLTIRLRGGPAEQAAAIDAGLARFRSDRERYQTEIRAFWSARYAPERFAEDAQALVAEMLAER